MDLCFHVAGVTSAPTNFKQVSHVGFNPDGSVDFSNIPPEWKAIFKQIGLRKNDLKDKAFAKQVYAIMSDALGTGTGSDSPSSVSGQLLAPIPPPIVDVPNAPLPPPLVPPPLDTTTTTTTTSGIGTKSTPPPPPPPPPPPSQSSTSNKPLTPPVRSAASTGSSQPPPRNETKDVVAILKRAMEQHRMAMAGRHDEEDDEWSDWSDDDSDAQSASGSVASEDQKN